MWISIGMAIWAQPNGPARLAHKMDQAGPIFLSPDPFGLGPFRPAKKGPKAGWPETGRPARLARFRFFFSNKTIIFSDILIFF